MAEQQNLVVPTNDATNSRNRFLIRGGNFGATAGRAAFGNNLPNNFVPQNRLHLHQTSGTVRLQFTKNSTGTGATDGFQLGITGACIAQIIQRENRPLITYTGGTTGLRERMRIRNTTVGGTPNVTRVSISYGGASAPITNPRSLLSSS